MKDSKSVWLGILIIVVVVLATTGCVFYNVLNKEDFRKQFGAIGYTISDNDEAEYDAPTKLKATKSDVPYVVQYYEFDSEKDSQKVYQNYKKNIVKYITTDSKNNETTKAVSAKFVAKSTDEYIVISRVKNTLIFIAGTNDYASEIDNFLENIKY